MSFTLKSINASDHIGRDLIELRERVGLNRLEAARLCHMTESFVAALEEEQWDEIGDPVYAEHLLRAYVRAFNGKESYYIQKFRRCVAERQERSKKDESRLIRPLRVRLADFLVGARLLAVAGFGVFVVVLGYYVYHSASSISAAPPLTVTAPAEGARLQEPLASVEGTTLPEAAVTINGQPAVVESGGTFHLILDIPRGTTEITISAKKRHGREAVVVRHVIYERPLPPIFGPASSSTK